MNRWMSVGLCLLVAGGLCGAFGAGLLLPTDQSLPALAIRHQRVDIDIKDGVATARIEQVFKNQVQRDLEAVYVFPLPPGASIADFAMYIDGKRVSGELLEKDKARGIYEDIVRRMKDPGLLEYMGGGLFKMRVYPVRAGAEQKIEVTYTQPLDFDSGVYRLVYPLRTSAKPSATVEDFTVAARLNSSIPIKTIYSPSHKIGVDRKSNHEAVIGFEEDRSRLNKDFVLYYGVSKKAFGLNLLTHAVKASEGHFMMMLAPSAFDPDAAPLRKDVVFVLDTSGSMAGAKIEQARTALKYCVRKLHSGDRFNIIRFSTDTGSLADGLRDADADTTQAALDFVDGIEARGGTAIDEALRTALRMDFRSDRPSIIVFLTDGKPTVGESDTDAILANVKRAAPAGVRIFVFGVGEEVNTHLLDRISGAQGGFSQYVDPDEDIEVKVSGFADRISRPVLVGLELRCEGISTSQVYPRELPDLFAGDQLTVLGRYEGHGPVRVTLRGVANGAQRTFSYPTDVARTTAGNTFIPRLWATRRVGYLLDQIRLQGDEDELRDEVVRLSKEYGIVTPYTSYLVLEEEQVQRPNEEPASPPTSPVPFFAKAFGRGGGAAMAPAEVSSYIARESGADAVDLSRDIRMYREAERVDRDIAALRQVAGKTFRFTDGRWVDDAYMASMKKRTVRFGSAAYFELLEQRPELRKWLSLGRQVTVVIDGNVAVVVEE